MSDLFWVACAVCGRRKDFMGDTIEEAWRKAEERGWQVYRLTGAEHVEIRCPKHWVQGWADKASEGRER